MKFLKQDNRNWDIYYRMEDEFNIIRLYKYDFSDLDYPYIYYDFLEILYRGRNVLISQFVDEGQLSESVRENLFEIQNLYEIKILISSEFSNPFRSNNGSEIYYAHVLGKINQGWLRHTVRFGATSLSNVIWGENPNISLEFNELPKWNQTIWNWFSDDLSQEFYDLIKMHDFICLTMDDTLSIIFRKNFEEHFFLDKIDKLSKLFNYHLNITKEG